MYPVTARTTPHRLAERVGYDRAVAHAILDEAYVCHLAFTTPDGPRVLPTLHARVGATGGRGRIRVPLRPAVSTIPRCRSALYAAATVAGLSPRFAASSRTGGRASPAPSAPRRTPASTVAEISAAVDPAI